MMGYWKYMCDYGHSWTVYRDLDDCERPEDALCSYGHEAVTLKKCPSARRFEIVIHSAACIVDRVKGQVDGEGRFYVSLRDQLGNVTATSKAPMAISDATELAGKLATLPDDKAERLLAS